MVSMDAATLGGRLRVARMSLGKSLREFSRAVGITYNYLSLIERDLRMPSQELVSRIAEASGRDFGWLMTGQEPAASERSVPGQADRRTGLSVMDVNAQLFLNLILLRCPHITKEQLAAMLLMPLDALEGILDGSDTAFRNNWMTFFPTLARYLDMPAVRRDLESLDAFLHDEERNMKSEILASNVQAYFRKEKRWDYLIDGPIVTGMAEYDGAAVPCVSIPMRGREAFKDFLRIRYFPGVAGERGFFKKMAEQEAAGIPENTHSAVVFDDKASYDCFVDYLSAYCEEMDDRAEESGHLFELYMSVLHVYGDTMEIRDSWNGWDIG